MHVDIKGVPFTTILLIFIFILYTFIIWNNASIKNRLCKFIINYYKFTVMNLMTAFWSLRSRSDRTVTVSPKTNWLKATCSFLDVFLCFVDDLQWSRGAPQSEQWRILSINPSLVQEIMQNICRHCDVILLGKVADRV